MLDKVCAPAMLYLAFSITQIIIDIFKNLYNTAFLKFLVMIVFTIALNLLCQSGLGVISWFIVFLPFIMMTVITSLLLFVLGLHPSKGGRVSVDYLDRENERHHEVERHREEEKMLYDKERQISEETRHWREEREHEEKKHRREQKRQDKKHRRRKRKHNRSDHEDPYDWHDGYHSDDNGHLYEAFDNGTNSDDSSHTDYDYSFDQERFQEPHVLRQIKRHTGSQSLI